MSWSRREVVLTVSPVTPYTPEELRAFDEIVGPEPAALVEIGVLLTDRRRLSLLERTISVRRPLADRSPVRCARQAPVRGVVEHLARGAYRSRKKSHLLWQRAAW